MERKQNCGGRHKWEAWVYYYVEGERKIKHSMLLCMKLGYNYTLSAK